MVGWRVDCGVERGGGGKVFESNRWCESLEFEAASNLSFLLQQRAAVFIEENKVAHKEAGDGIDII